MKRTTVEKIVGAMFLGFCGVLAVILGLYLIDGWDLVRFTAAFMLAIAGFALVLIGIATLFVKEGR
jgi:hypothetical protein